MTGGCGAQAAPDEEDLKDNIRPMTVVLNDGRTVECVIFAQINEGGLWCTLQQTDEDR